MTRDSHLQSKNWFRQLFEVAHHLSNSWPSYIRWHAFWLEYILSEDTEPDMIITSFAKVFDYKITSSFDWLVASRPHSFLKTPTNSHLTTERPNYFFETYLVTMPMILSNGRPSILLLLGSPKSLAQNPVLANEELALAPLISHRLQLVVPHVLNLVNHSE